jgi:cell division septation protein DedD
MTSRLTRTTCSVLVLLAASAGCAGGSGRTASTPAATVVPSSSATLTGVPPTAPTPTPIAPTPTAPTPTSPAVPTTTPTTTSPAVTTSAVTTPAATARLPSPGAAPWPRAVLAPARDQVVWAVYLAVGHSNRDPVVTAAARRAARAGYDAAFADPQCEDGALQALRLGSDDFWTTTEVYFATSDQAAGFTTRWRAEGGTALATLRVTVGCQG